MKICYYKNKNNKDGLSAQCRTCAKVYRDSHKQEKNNYPSSNLIYKQIYYQNNKDNINAMKKRRYLTNPKKFNQQSRKSYQINRIERLSQQAIYYMNNRKYFAQKNKIYRNNNIDKILLRNRQRKNLLSIFPIIQQSAIDNLLATNDNQCFYCKVEIKRGINLHLDHVVPLSRGGEHSITNLVPACAFCNLKKGTKTAEEFLIGKHNDIY